MQIKCKRNKAFGQLSALATNQVTKKNKNKQIST